VIRTDRYPLETIFAAPARAPAKWNRFADQRTRQIDILEHVLIAKVVSTLAEHAVAPDNRENNSDFHCLGPGSLSAVSAGIGAEFRLPLTKVMQ